MTAAQAIQLDNTENNVALTEDFCIGMWRVCPALNRVELRSGTLSRHLEPRLTKLLCYLAANQGKVICREELVNLLWPRVIVNENSLTRAVSELRKQLVITNDPNSTYIETIPKRGYRLLVSVESASATVILPARKYFVPHFNRSNHLGFAALCFSLASVLWFTQNMGSSALPDFEQSLLLADEVVGEKAYFGGKVSPSTSESDTLMGESIEAPIINEAKTHFAYIQYDQTGSTIYIGDIAEAMKEPIPAYNSSDKLFNLAWSPIGNSLLFAKQGKLTTAALFSDSTSNVDLYSLDINSFEVFQLIEQTPKPESKASGLNLT
ncbi:MAG: winged helix-turn-helix domain-containing protein [Gammaproteobacteria bacterium]|nr:winged helix-turn-helix domain-containing protein [Gammaproteobacteria bacterium]